MKVVKKIIFYNFTKKIETIVFAELFLYIVIEHPCSYLFSQQISVLMIVYILLRNIV